MTVELDGHTYHMQFEYNRRQARWQTLCRILRRDPGTDPTEVANGWAYCSPPDNFSKETGRKIALKRALEGFSIFLADADEGGATKAIRKLFWQAYLNRKAKQNATQA